MSTGNHLPVSVNHYYNSCLTARNDFYCGYGWKTSMHQYVYSYTISGTDYYIWMDGDGTEHFFPKTGSAPYEDAEAFGCLTGIVKTSSITDTGVLTQRRRQTAAPTGTLGNRAGDNSLQLHG